MARDDLLTRYRQRIEHSRKWRKDEGFDDLWNRLVKLYAGKHFPKGLNDEDRIAVNVSFSTINVIYPSVSVNHPKITVAARDPENEDRGVIIEAVINYWWRRYRIKPQFRLAVKDFLIVGFGWLKTGWRYVEEEVDADEDDIRQTFEEQVAQADEFAAANPHLAGDLPTDDEIRAALPTKTVRVVEDRPFVERVSFEDVFVDPEATNMQNIRWIAQRIIRDLDEVRNDDQYDKRARREVEPDLDVKWEDPDKQRRYEDDIKRCTIWEFYDVKNGTFSVFPENGKRFLVEPKPMPYAFGHPFVMLRNYDVPDQFYPMGDLEAIEPIQQELNKLRSQSMNHRKRFHRKYLYDPSVFDAKGRDALESDRDNVFVPVRGGQRPLAETVVPLPQVPLPPDFYNQSEQVEHDLVTISGVNEYMRGSLPEIRRTATEASIIADAANSRAADKLAIIEDAIAQVAENLVQLAQQYLDGEQVARIQGRNGAHLWVPFDPEDIEGEYDFEVEGGSTQPLNEQLRRQTALQMLQTLMPFTQPTPMGPPIINPVELVTHVLRDGFGIKNPARFLAPAQMAPPAGAMPPPGGETASPTPDVPAEAQPPEQPPAEGGVAGIPPELLAQLQGQVGLNLGGTGQPR